MTKTTVTLLALAAATALTAAPHALTKKWETEPLLKVPESVLYDGSRGVLFVSNIDGEPWADDGKGSIAKVGLDGKIIAAEWVTGLSAPKGLGVHGNKLYAADIDRVVVIDIEKGAIAGKIPVVGAHGLNDISVGADGTVYVSDSKDKKIYAIKDGTSSLLIKGLTAVNGVNARDGELYFLDDGSIYRLGGGNEKALVSSGPRGNGDGLEGVSEGEWLVTYWQGVIQFAHRDGSRETLLDTSAEKVNSADLGYDAEHRVVFIPTFFKNSIVAYELK